VTVHHIDSGIADGRTLCCLRPTAVLPLGDTVTSTERLVSCDGSRPAPDERVCDECGGRNVTWWADSDRWNQVTAALPTGRWSILCPSCFVRLWETATGLTAVWHLVPENIKAER
jgi:hypothetical protein